MSYYLTSADKIIKNENLYIYSDKFHNKTSDSLKDEDNIGWLRQIKAEERKKWIDVLTWMRVVDRLIERDTWKEHDTKNKEYSFPDFLRDWKRLRHHDEIDKKSPFFYLFENIRQRWDEEHLTERELKVWDSYLESQAYFIPETEVKTTKDYDDTLRRLSGPIFLALPNAPKCMA